jgi:GNAT superfamily N-acetyltransferase
MNVIVPIPRCNVTVRSATLSDLPFIDGLQKQHTKQVGWMPTKQLEGKIKAGHVIVAEEVGSRQYAVGGSEDASSLPTADCLLPTPVGYCIGSDQYFKRDDVGIIYQMNVVPDRRRGLIGATLVKAMFERAAYGCRLFCCWCAQDIEANRFWESLGFVPLAFRAGSRGKGRVHIFWQRRIRAGDTTTPYWFPSQTASGSIREDRLVLPIPPDTHWRDAKPIVLPQTPSDEPKQLPTPRQRKPKSAPAINPASIASGGLRFDTPNPELAEVKAKPEPKKRVKNDPRLVAAARELRDRWLEQVNATPVLSHGKYDVSRALEARQPNTVVAIARAMPVLPAPIAA